MRMICEARKLPPKTPKRNECHGDRHVCLPACFLACMFACCWYRQYRCIVYCTYVHIYIYNSCTILSLYVCAIPSQQRIHWVVDKEDLIKRHLSMLVGAPEADSMRSVEIWLWLNQLWFMVDMTLYDYNPN